MRKIRNTMPFLHALLLSALLLAGCVREEFPGAGSVAEGEPAQIAFNLVVPAMSSGSSTRALTPEQESKIENLRVMVFRADGSVVTNSKYDNANSGSDTQFTVTVDSYSGNNCTILFIANVSYAEIETRLQSAATLSDVEQIVTTATQLDFGMNTSHPLMMMAKLVNVSLSPGSNTHGAPVQLQFMTAKVTLKVIDRSPTGQEVIIIGWDVENAPARSYLFPNTTDVNPSGTSGDKDDYWLTTDVDYPFEVEDKPNKTFSQTLYVFENRRGGRVSKSLPTNWTDRYPGMSFNDQDHRGKGWFKPARATAIVITAMHKTTFEMKQVKAHIYLGADNHSDYNIERGKHYTFTVTVNGLDDIKVDTNVDYYLGDFLVEHGDNLTMDAHPDFRPMRIHAVKGKMTMEILDNAGRAYNEPGFDATWLKISPLDLMWHQVKQTGDAAKWQQDATPESNIVRGRYIPHTSVRQTLSDAQKWWTAYSDIAAIVTDGDDNEMTFADATYRMCYKITDIPFTEVALTNKMLYVYADEYLHRSIDYGKGRSARVRLTFYKEGGNPDMPEVRTFLLDQSEAYSVFKENDSSVGLLIMNPDGTFSSVRQKFITERFKECYHISLYPGGIFRWGNYLQWGFEGQLLYNGPDKRRNGKFLTENAVYTDVRRQNHEVIGFGETADSYRPMYGADGQLIQRYTGNTSGAPYYYPDASANIYHPIYKTTAARYCHEKNRDLNGDGKIDVSESHWYLPSIDELQILNLHKEAQTLVDDYGASYRPTASSTEIDSDCWATAYFSGDMGYDVYEFWQYNALKNDQAQVQCVRRIQ